MDSSFLGILTQSHLIADQRRTPLLAPPPPPPPPPPPHPHRVIPRTLMPREITGETIGEVRAVSDMHQRKAEMAHQADAFIALPGGYGTLEELLEVITWAQLGIHHKPVGLLNVEGYYNSLLSFLDKAVDEGFISPTARRIIVSAPTAKQLVKELEVYIYYLQQ
ncbi:hypothetical protein HYC85_021054 [Camellia sinensis]|uniref:Cytokinin riboside 5'-monophosphate phosphoribohydrolase n=1 Tax=Camellia sinensis TaxID=4442 RepID=A0A7J7GHB3_CAMSI|nr:hypothetical protein HYC85_021054 [Camellia sinensis]